MSHFCAIGVVGGRACNGKVGKGGDEVGLEKACAHLIERVRVALRPRLPRGYDVGTEETGRGGKAVDVTDEYTIVHLPLML